VEPIWLAERAARDRAEQRRERIMSRLFWRCFSSAVLPSLHAPALRSRRTLGHLVAGLAILSILAVAAAAQAATLTVCNKTGEKISDLFLEEAKLRSAALIANGSCVA